MLSAKMRGKSLVYLDNSATALTPKPVIAAITQYYREYGVSVHRGIYELSEKATREYEEARVMVARFLHSPNDGQIIITHGSTESSNLIAYSWGRKFLGKGDVILSTEYEHHSSLVPWHAVCQSQGSEMAFIPIDRDSLTLDMEAYENLLNERVKILVISAMSNVTGYIPPLKKMIELAHANDTIVAVDGAQLASHHTINLKELNPDFLFCSAHKMLGPTGVGILWGRTSLLEAMDPFMYGGNMILKVSRDSSTYHPLPQKFEAGTPNIAGVLGMGQALSYLTTLGMENIAAHEQSLMAIVRKQASNISNLVHYLPSQSQTKEQGNIFSFNIDGIHNHDLGALLDAQGIAVRTGFHCAMPLINLLTVDGIVRASFSFYNTEDDVNSLFHGIEEARKIFSI